MKDNHWEGRDHGHGWESNKTLLSHRFIERDKAGKSWNTNFRGPKDRISLTQVGFSKQSWDGPQTKNGVSRVGTTLRQESWTGIFEKVTSTQAY